MLLKTIQRTALPEGMGQQLEKLKSEKGIAARSAGAVAFRQHQRLAIHRPDRPEPPAR